MCPEPPGSVLCGPWSHRLSVPSQRGGGGRGCLPWMPGHGAGTYSSSFIQLIQPCSGGGTAKAWGHKCVRMEVISRPQNSLVVGVFLGTGLGYQVICVAAVAAVRRTLGLPGEA